MCWRANLPRSSPRTDLLSADLTYGIEDHDCGLTISNYIVSTFPWGLWSEEIDFATDA